MDILGEVYDLSDIKQALLHACLNECDNKSDVEELVEQGHQSKPREKFLGKCASFPSAVSPSGDDDEIETALRRMFSEDSVQSPYSHAISLPTPMKLVSALKVGREKRGLARMNLTVTWAPDVYDPPPTSVSHTVRGKKQQKSKKNNDKKKIGKRGQKGNNSSRGSGGGGKDNKQFRRGCGSSDRCYKPLQVQGRVVNAAGDLDGFNVGSPAPYCGSSFLKNSPTRVHYSVA
ncbi:uncharacterized protein LOC111293611 [Durio zibethinus]|uniref:Uncharacterized protein LOC111293611 n=1 Tax=Durio zibethinus TaxID=66656 RepID=A0A6P5YPY3_DURZI|nr:uncharacterized protein LOC111293611 [Durio zibethinus]XP_022742157.1 uncharacterized protein LOC111293611 [Durio zibethinus]